MNEKHKIEWDEHYIAEKWSTESEQNQILRKLDEIQNSQTKALLYIKDKYRVVRYYAQKKLGLYETK